jgi:hypothetical protein
MPGAVWGIVLRPYIFFQVQPVTVRDFGPSHQTRPVTVSNWAISNQNSAYLRFIKYYSPHWPGRGRSVPNVASSVAVQNITTVIRYSVRVHVQYQLSSDVQRLLIGLKQEINYIYKI